MRQAAAESVGRPRLTEGLLRRIDGQGPSLWEWWFAQAASLFSARRITRCAHARGKERESCPDYRLLPFFQDLNHEALRSQKQPFSACFANPAAADFANISTKAVHGYVAMPPLEETLTAHLEFSSILQLVPPVARANKHTAQAVDLNCSSTYYTLSLYDEHFLRHSALSSLQSSRKSQRPDRAFGCLPTIEASATQMPVAFCNQEMSLHL
ncbi:hypothetical protein ROHU_025894 [Labeo rohita]|uniref:Uncharacterized protein n=1 Tax=Labeo rohita TaxID=84645 RepID=A0A498MDU3_LABRO|nr:hypothetical protein ROHU_025894 [Labeo rohita]